MNLDVLHGLDEPVQALVRIIQQYPAREDQFPLAVPYRPANQPRVGIIVRAFIPLTTKPTLKVMGYNQDVSRRPVYTIHVFYGVCNYGYKIAWVRSVNLNG